jgi:hypothetical protein
VGRFVDIDRLSVTDLRRLYRDIRKISPETAKEVRTRFKKAAEPTLEDTRRRQPERTGELKRKTRIYVARGTVTIRSRAQHARTSEFGGHVRLWGTERRFDYPAHPAVLPAAAEKRQKFVNEANAALIDACKKVGMR